MRGRERVVVSCFQCSWTTQTSKGVGTSRESSEGFEKKNSHPADLQQAPTDVPRTTFLQQFSRSVVSHGGGLASQREETSCLFLWVLLPSAVNISRTTSQRVAFHPTCSDVQLTRGL